jgi:hypothetical protein
MPSVEGQALLQPEPPLHIFLAGDAGENSPSDMPALDSMRKAIEANSGQKIAIFLGDNIYPSGLPAENHPSRKQAEQVLRLCAQAASGAERVIFIPGNHDWDYPRPGGWKVIRGQETFLSGLGEKVTMEPKGGCPGPVIIEFEKPAKAEDGCPVFTSAALEMALEKALDVPAGVVTGVLTHHPILSGGPHGGTFTWKDHVFPMRNWKAWLWVPLPGIGSVYVTARKKALPPQDLESPRYSELRQMLGRVYAKHPPVFLASGHDHSLQIQRSSPDGPYQLISGAGSRKQLTPSRDVAGQLFRSSRPGLVKVTIDRSGTRAAVYENREGKLSKAFETRLR